jgi:hypothetical protein
MKKQFYLVLVLSIAFGSIIAWIDTRPNWDDPGVTVGLILIATMICGGLSPSLAWLWALLIGGIVVESNILIHDNCQSVVALFVAFVGSY